MKTTNTRDTVGRALRYLASELHEIRDSTVQYEAQLRATGDEATARDRLEWVLADLQKVLEEARH